jgi:hypothetical protein
VEIRDDRIIRQWSRERGWVEEPSGRRHHTAVAAPAWEVVGLDQECNTRPETSLEHCHQIEDGLTKAIGDRWVRVREDIRSVLAGLQEEQPLRGRCDTA